MSKYERKIIEIAEYIDKVYEDSLANKLVDTSIMDENGQFNDLDSSKSSKK